MENELLHEIRKAVEEAPSWLSIRDAVKTSSLSESTIRRAINNGDLKANQIGSVKNGKWLIKTTWLEDYLTS